MSDDDLAVGARARKLRQDAGDVFIRQAVKTVANDAGLAHGVRQAEELGDQGLRTTEGRIEAGDLRGLRPDIGDGPDRCDVVRLMSRCQFNEGIELCEHALVDTNRGMKSRTTVDDAVARACNLHIRQSRADGSEQPRYDRLMIAAHWQAGSRFQRRGNGASDLDRRFDADRIDIAFAKNTELGCLIEGKLDARGAGIENQYGARHSERPDWFFTTSWANAQDACRANVPSARLVSMMGTQAPNTRPAASAPAR